MVQVNRKEKRVAKNRNQESASYGQLTKNTMKNYRMMVKIPKIRHAAVAFKQELYN